jgi:transposase-like protein
MTFNLTDPIFTDEDKARVYFEEIRWPHGVVCPHCGNADSSRIYSIAANVKAKIRAGLRECQDCHGQFTVRTGGVMESSHLPLTKWALAYRFMSSSKKGMSAHQLHHSLGVTYKTAWFMAHRIREAMREIDPSPMGGEGKTVEADEAFIGGKEGNKHASSAQCAAALAAKKPCSH